MFGLDNEIQEENDDEQKLLDRKQSNIIQSPSMVVQHVGTAVIEEKNIDHKKIDKLFEIPLAISICMLAMAHGSNEINVSAPLAANIFLLNGSSTEIEFKEEFISILVGLVSLIVGTVTIGQRYLHNYRQRFMTISVSNGTIANTCCAIVLLGSSWANYTVSCTYLLVPALALVRSADEGKPLDKYKMMKGGIFAFFVIFMSASVSVICSWALLSLDYNGPNNELNNSWYSNTTYVPESTGN
jgi:phosphate/sulfate permease